MSYTGGLDIGQTYTFNVTKGAANFGTRFMAWVDWNNNGALNDPGEMIMDVTQTSPVLASVGSVVVPLTATPGTHRMRVWTWYQCFIGCTPVLTPCDVLGALTNQGEIRDFNITLAGGCTPPVIGACPADITQCDNHVATWTSPTATGTAPTVVCSPVSGSTFTTGTTLVTCTATNACGTSSCSFNITINETPVIGACPADIVQCDNNLVTFSTPTATGSPAATVNCTPASGSTFANGTTVVTCIASNVCGSSDCSFNVTINESPVIGLCPANIDQCDNHVATWTAPTATGTSPVVTCTPASGSTFPNGTTSVTCSATNSCGTSSCSFDVTIGEAAVIGACPADIDQCDNHVATFSTPVATGFPAATVSCTPASGSTFVTGTTVVTCVAANACGNSSCSFNVTINESPVIAACPSDITQYNNHVATWTDPTATGTPTPTVTCSPASGSTFVTGTTAVTCTASNGCAPAASCTFTVTINESPVIGACPANITQCDNHVATWTNPTATGSPLRR